MDSFSWIIAFLKTVYYQTVFYFYESFAPEFDGIVSNDHKMKVVLH